MPAAEEVPGREDKEFLLGLDSRKFFTEPHYNGYPAVLVRLPAVTVRELRAINTEAWRSQAPKDPDPKGRVARGRAPAGRRRQPVVAGRRRV